MQDDQPESYPPARFRIVGDPAPLFGAMAKAQKAYKELTRTRTVEVFARNPDGGQGRKLYDFEYAPYEQIMAATRDALTDAGCTLIQPICEHTDSYTIHTILGHESGSYIETRIDVPKVYDKFDKIDYQKCGSAITYNQRYSGTGILGIAAGYDDDGNEAAGNAGSFADKKPPAQKRPETPPPPNKHKVGQEGTKQATPPKEQSVAAAPAASTNQPSERPPQPASERPSAPAPAGGKPPLTDTQRNEVKALLIARQVRGVFVSKVTKHISGVPAAEIHGGNVDHLLEGLKKLDQAKLDELTRED